MASNLIDWVTHARGKVRSVMTQTEVSLTPTVELAKSKRPSRAPSMLPENAFCQRGATCERAEGADGPLL